MDWRFVALNGTMCLIAIGFAAHVRDGKAPAIALAGYVLLDWMLYVSAWTPYSPAEALLMRNRDLWALSDAVFGCLAIGLAWPRWWSWALWSIATFAVCLYVFYDMGLYSFDTYSTLLDKTLSAKVALFMLIGGPGVGDRIARLADRIGHVRRPGASALSRTPAE